MLCDTAKSAAMSAPPSILLLAAHPDLAHSRVTRAMLSAAQGLSNVHVLRVARDGIAYVGFEFGCAWEEEHGLGVMMHRDRVVAAGGADVSFLEWIAEEDAKI